ncbi:MAG: hypothetical protein N7Q72_02815, partial [Spiroplasma sp. Tabriz.8]|nr:hypothetical protein [Spiroplasma sp. Tabriz.8]
QAITVKSANIFLTWRCQWHNVRGVLINLEHLHPKHKSCNFIYLFIYLFILSLFHCTKYYINRYTL